MLKTVRDFAIKRIELGNMFDDTKARYTYACDSPRLNVLPCNANTLLKMLFNHIYFSV